MEYENLRRIGKAQQEIFTVWIQAEIEIVAGAIFASIPAKRYGRKKVLQVIAVFFIVAAIGCSRDCAAICRRRRPS